MISLYIYIYMQTTIQEQLSKAYRLQSNMNNVCLLRVHNLRKLDPKHKLLTMC